MNSVKRSLIAGALVVATLALPQRSNAAIGLVSLIGGPAGTVIIEIGAGMVVGSLVFGVVTDELGKRGVINADTPIFMNFLFWPGLVVMDKSTGTFGDEAAIANVLAHKQMTQFDRPAVNAVAGLIAAKVNSGVQKVAMPGQNTTLRVHLSSAEIDQALESGPAYDASAVAELKKSLK